MSEKEIELSIPGDTLTNRGEKNEEKEDKNKNYYYSERSSGNFIRSIPIPRQAETSKASVHFHSTGQ
jgi:HSP20 family protein